jgi:translation elongation factor EF-Tu-like GTPase
MTTASRYGLAMPSASVTVSSADGPLPETVEQFKALQAQGATAVDVVLTRTDLVDDEELLELVELEIRDLAQQNGLTVGSITREPAGSSGPTGIYGPPS